MPSWGPGGIAAADLHDEYRISTVLARSGSGEPVFRPASVGILEHLDTSAGTGRDAARLEVARRLGATHTVDVDDGDLVEQVRELTDGRMCDLVVDVTSAAPAAAEVAFDLAAVAGTIVLAGFKEMRRALKVKEPCGTLRYMDSGDLADPASVISRHSALLSLSPVADSSRWRMAERGTRTLRPISTQGSPTRPPVARHCRERV